MVYFIYTLYLEQCLNRRLANKNVGVQGQTELTFLGQNELRFVGQNELRFGGHNELTLSLMVPAGFTTPPMSLKLSQANANFENNEVLNGNEL